MSKVNMINIPSLRFAAKTKPWEYNEFIYRLSMYIKKKCTGEIMTDEPENVMKALFRINSSIMTKGQPPIINQRVDLNNANEVKEILKEISTELCEFFL